MNAHGPETEQPPVEKSPRHWLTLPAAIVFALCGLLGLPWELWQAAFALVAGWVPFLIRVVPKMTVDWPQVWLTAAAILVFVVGLHRLLRWLWGGGSLTAAEGWRFRWTLAIATLVLFMFVAGTSMVGIAHQAAWLARSQEPWRQGNAREAARRNGSARNLVAIAHAARDHQASRGGPPEGATMDHENHPRHSWMTAILPFVEERDLYGKVRFDERWDAPVNWPVFMTRVSAYERPGVDHDGAPPESVLADYASNALVIGPGPPVSLDEIPDGSAKTLLGGEVTAGRVPWGGPGNWRDPRRGLSDSSPETFGSTWRGGVTLLVFADGRVATVNADIDPRVLAAMATPDGGEPVPDDLR